MERAITFQPDAYDRSRWPACHNPYVVGLRLLSASKAKELKAQLVRDSERAFSLKHETGDDRSALQKRFGAEYARAAKLYWIDGHGTIHRLFPKVTKRGLKR